MKVRVKQSFNDWQANILRHKDEEFEITDERYGSLSENLSACFDVSIEDVLAIIEDEIETQGDETTPYD